MRGVWQNFDIWSSHSLRSMWTGKKRQKNWRKLSLTFPWCLYFWWLPIFLLYLAEEPYLSTERSKVSTKLDIIIKTLKASDEEQITLFDFSTSNPLFGALFNASQGSLSASDVRILTHLSYAIWNKKFRFFFKEIIISASMYFSMSCKLDLAFTCLSGLPIRQWHLLPWQYDYMWSHASSEKCKSPLLLTTWLTVVGVILCWRLEVR